MAIPARALPHSADGRRRPPLRRAVSSLGVRNYRLYFWGQTVSVAGTWMQTMALAFLVLKLTGSGTDLGAASAVRLLPFVLLGPMGGVIADRADKRRLLYVTQSASAVVAAVFAALTAFDAATFPLVMVLSLVAGCLTVFDNPARQSLIGELVPRDQLSNAVTLSSVSVNLSRVIGAAVGGTLVAAVGLSAAFALNAVSFAGVLVSLALMRASQMHSAGRVPRAGGQVREGLRYARRTPALFLPLLMVTITGTLAYEFPISLPLVARGAFHGGAGIYGLMAAVMAAGAVAGGLVAASRGGRRRAASLAGASIGWGVAILAAALAPDLPLECVALLFVGYGSITFNSYAKTALQLAAAPSMRGRVMAMWALAWGGTTVVGGPVIGWVAEEFGSRWTLVVGGAPTVLLGLAMLPALRRIDHAADRPPGELEPEPTPAGAGTGSPAPADVEPTA
ncbi:MFS transporter [Streptantibioticus silvisoli]|uniref:MFS transporter n=1 Tax=Streptantibioticus silvisoli TaxID=2705255 RepID=A0ABT6W1E9_9ACTN|nr:MFS transporter [Streptantibioticus silvisoli]MDI5964509.1 MFS transporter [Streptantibioticus silvisoli]